MSTGIPYVQEACNPVLGCTKCSPACENCWAVGVVAGLLRKLKNPKYDGLVKGNEWTGQQWIDLNAFDKCRTKKSKSFLLSSLGDWLHEWISIETCRRLLGYMESFPQHRFYTLTKRPERWAELGPIPPNVWLGASVWDQESYKNASNMIYATEYLSNRWFSIEPLLGPITIRRGLYPQWIVVGCESGKNRRPCKIEWIRSIVRQCKEYRIPCFVKQIDMPDVLVEGKTHVSTDPLDWPMDLQVQEIPA